MRVTDLFDNYLNGTLSPSEKTAFENQLQEDETLAQALSEHRSMIGSLHKVSRRADLKNKLEAIHNKEFGNSRVIALHREESFARKHGRTIAMAASTAFVAVLTTVAILSAGGYLFKQQSNQITNLNRVVMELKASSDGIVEGITKPQIKKIVYAPANLEGTAFALNNRGYILTSFHMINGSDSIFIQNSSTERTSATLIMSDPSLDLAVLKIDNEEITKNWQVPFTLKEKSTDIGDKVFTLGYPRRDMVYGEGSLSSLSGYSNDTSMYQISIPVNPGNSGGPLLDESGNVIGVIRGKIAGAEATGFAIKAHRILNSLRMSEDDTVKAHLMSANPRKANLKSLKRADQVKKINPYVFNVLVYKND